ncbi:MAG: glycosyltransferase family 4 protein [Chloroflexota bacterium]|nr:glycosyltransferase family 4 protein [Chloroflexota bacterium]
MRIGLCAYLLHAGSDYRAAGVSTYARQLIEHLPRNAPQHEYLAFVGRDAPPLPVRSVVAPAPTWRAATRIGWEQAALPLLAARERVDVLHGTVNVVPLLARQPSVVTVHDLAFVRHPERFAIAKRGYLRAAVSASTRRAAHLIAVSENTKRDLVELWNVPEEKISVVYSGVDRRYRPAAPSESMKFRNERFEGRPIILHVGTLEPRKNVDMLVRAFAGARRELGLPHILALVGAPGWRYQSLFDLVRDLGLQGAVHFAGYVPPDELPDWYNASDFFAYPSVYEGFGFPVAEAMACGVPTITTNSSALVEVAGDACVTVEPGSEEALRGAIVRLAEDGKLRVQLRERGLRRAATFSWDETARMTAQVYDRVAGMAP